MKILRTQGAILCVAGVRKFTFSTPIVTTTEKVTRIMVKSRYWLVTVTKARWTRPRSPCQGGGRRGRWAG